MWWLLEKATFNRMPCSSSIVHSRGNFRCVRNDAATKQRRGHRNRIPDTRMTWEKAVLWAGAAPGTKWIHSYMFSRDTTRSPLTTSEMLSSSVRKRRRILHCDNRPPVAINCTGSWAADASLICRSMPGAAQDLSLFPTRIVFNLKKSFPTTLRI